eukprot:TRINITY_DN29093_c0_g1_i1.p1 TRINITY_DN29093_c0_g1~~TRINITY_DN29093_c0_g1_i1.p1  ORF type:complete len:341 (+),score=105.36 TRINITY_DN29093_c0_g1_i1:302-1324(+)
MAHQLLGACCRKLVRRASAVVGCVRLASTSADSSSVDIFDRHAKRLQRDRATLLEDSGREFDYLKAEVASRLADRLLDLGNRRLPVACDLGSQAGFLVQHLQQAAIDTLYHTEMSERMLQRDAAYDAARLSRLRPRRVLADDEFVPFGAQSLDLVMSSMSLHWVNDLPGTFAQVLHALKPDGVFLAAMLGGEHTLHELRTALLLADQERLGGVASHVSPFAGVADIGNLLSRARFALPTVDTETITVRYRDAWRLMTDLQGMAENNCVRTRPPYVPREVFEAAAALYQQLYADPSDGSVPATFQVIYMIGWAPDVSQPKSKRRGSAQVSLKTLSDNAGQL